MRNTILSICLLAAGFTAGAQNPGYLGKHLNVYAMMDPSFAWRYFDEEVDYYIEYYYFPATVDKQYGMEVTPGLGIEYTLGKTVTAGVSMRFLANKTPLTLLMNANLDEIAPPAYVGETNVKGTYTGFYLKFYSFRRDGFIAPVGKYHQFEFITGKSHFETLEGGVTNGYTQPDVSYMFYDIPGNYDFYDLDFTNAVEDLQYEPVRSNFLRYAYGAETVLFNKVPLDYSMFLTLPITRLSLDDYYDETGITDANDYNVKSTASTMIIGLSLKVGFLVI